MVVAVLVTYLPVLSARYGYSDDYRLLYGYQRTPREMVDVELANGRPGSLLLHWLSGQVVTDVGGLRWLRLACVLGIAAVCVVVMRLARSAGRRPLVAFAMGLVVAALPSSQITGAWAVMWIVPPAMLLGICAALLADRGRLGLAVLALAASVLVYQPAAMTYWLPLTIWVTAGSWSWERRRLVRHGVVLGSAAVIGALGWWVGRAWSPVTIGRKQLSADPLAELSGFVRDVLPRELSPNPAAVRPMLVALVMVAMAVGLVLAERSPRRLMALVGLLLASYAPSLVIDGDTPTARSMTALGPVLVVLAFRSADGYARALPALCRVGPAPALALAVCLLGSAAHTVQVWFAGPQQRELKLVEAAVRSAHLRPGADAEVMGGAIDHQLAPSRSLDEFGNLSITWLWVPEPLVRLIRHEQSGSWAGDVRLIPLGSPPGPGVLDLDQAVAPR